MIKKQVLIAFLLFSAFFSTGCSKKPVNHGINIEPYDYHNPKYQDFFSQYIRKQKIGFIRHNYVSYNFDGKNIEKALDIKLTRDIVALVVITRIEPKENKVKEYNHYNGLEDFPWKTISCDPKFQIKDLVCIISPLDKQQLYIYFPKEKRMPYINQSIDMDCEHILTPQAICKIRNFPDYPYNLNIWIRLNDPNDFFYIIQYVENQIYQTTGEHIWQNSPQKDKH